MNELEKIRIVRLDNKIYHQGIGGKMFRIEKEGTMSYIYDMNFNDYTIAIHNFIQRRDDLLWLPNGDKFKIYYGHILDTNLGYFIAEDEIVGDK